jgi:hypothetical protein
MRCVIGNTSGVIVTEYFFMLDFSKVLHRNSRLLRLLSRLSSSQANAGGTKHIRVHEAPLPSISWEQSSWEEGEEIKDVEKKRS